MYLYIALALLGLIGLAIVIFGLVTPRKSPTIAVVALMMAAFQGFGAYYAWTDSQPTAVIASFGIALVVALIAAGRHLAR
jgi:hypothetical protein